MTGLDSARVVIIDDKWNEAKPLVTALSQQGIASCWFSGDATELPQLGNSFGPIRLAFLDIRLTDAIGSGNVDTLINVLKRLLSVDAAGYGIVMWTKHPEDVVKFKERLIRANVALPVFIIKMDKVGCLNGNSFDLSKVKRELKRCLSDKLPWDLLWEWEGDSVKASGELVSLLANLCKPTSVVGISNLTSWLKNWNRRLNSLLYTLVEEDLNNHAGAGKAAIRSIYSVLAPLVEDGIDNRSKKTASKLKKTGDRIMARGGSIVLDQLVVSRLNSMLTLTDSTDSKILSGNMYKTSVAGLKNVFSKIPTKKNLVIDIFHKQYKAHGNRNSERILVEVSPACDFAQGKIKRCRVVAGLMVKNCETKMVKKDAAYFWGHGPCRFNNENYHIFFDFRQLLTCNDKDLKNVNSFKRLRKSISADLQTKFSSHATRLGYLTVKS